MKSHTEYKSSSADREPLSDHVSGMRASMVGGHMKSAAPLDNPHQKLHFTGADREYAKYIFNDIGEDDGDVITYSLNGQQRKAIFTRHSRPGDPTPLQRAIFFKRAVPGKGGLPIYDLIETSDYTDHDHVFSSLKTETNKLSRLIRGETTHIAQGDDMTTMACVKGKEFVDGVNIPTAAMSHPGIIEDSYVISDLAAAWMHSYGYRRIVLSMREYELLLDTYGKYMPDGSYRPAYFPEIGEAIRDDGLVIASRSVDPLFGAIDLSAGELRDPSPFYDHCEYVDADPLHRDPATRSEKTGSRVIDIKVWRDEVKASTGGNSIHSTEENKGILEEYAKGLKQYYNAILKFVLSVKEEVIWSPKADVLINMALCSEAHELAKNREYRQALESHFQPRTVAGRKMREYRPDAIEKIMKSIDQPVERMLRDPITNYTIEIVVRYPIPVTVSSKITDLSGTKGIVGEVRPWQEMPLDEWGNVIHSIRSPNAVMRRSTYSPLFNIYWSAASEKLKRMIKPRLDAGDYSSAWSTLMAYLSCYNERWATVVNATHETVDKQKMLWEQIYNFSVRIWLPHELDKTAIEISKGLGDFAPEKSRLLITDYNGEKKLTENLFYSGFVETLRLDKTGREFSSMSSMYLNYLGMIDASGAGTGNYPVKYKAIKFGGEAERRLMEAYGKTTFDEIHNTANSPAAHRDLVRGLYMSPTPSAPGYLLDRTKHPLGTSQIDKLVDNLHTCEGFKLVRPAKELAHE